MNDYIINPWFFYLISIVNSVGVISIMVCILGSIVSLVLGAVWSDCDKDIQKQKDLIGICKKYLRVSIVVSALSLLVFVFTPGKETMIQMAVASKVTYTNLKAVKKEAKDLVDYVITKSKELAK